MKIVNAIIHIGLRPNRSLIFAQITRPTGRELVRICSQPYGYLTDVGDQIRRNDPTTLVKFLKVIGYRHDRSADDGNFEIDK